MPKFVGTFRVLEVVKKKLIRDAENERTTVNVYVSEPINLKKSSYITLITSEIKRLKKRSVKNNTHKVNFLYDNKLSHYTKIVKIHFWKLGSFL